MPSPLYLTFDDGPDPSWTPRVLEILAQHRAAATFFVLGWRVRESPELTRSIVAAGHRVELHGDAHLDHQIATPEQLAADTLAALDILGKCEIVPQWWRLPFGRSGRATFALADQHQLRIAGWDADSRDWRGDGWAQQPPEVLAAAESGGVVLLHDAIALGTPRGKADNTLEITAALLTEAERHGTPALALPDANTGDPIRDTPRASPFERSQATVRAWQAQSAEEARQRSSGQKR